MTMATAANPSVVVTTPKANPTPTPGYYIAMDIAMERAWKLHRVIPSENVESEELSVKKLLHYTHFCK